MPSFGFPLTRLALALGALCSLASAAKTVILQNPWIGTDRPASPPAIYLASSGTTYSTRQAFANPGYWSYTFVSNTPGGFFFTNASSATRGVFAMDGLSSATTTSNHFNLDAQFAGRDTVWILADTTAPDPRKPTLTTVEPATSRMVVLFRSPWTYSITFQAGGQSWVDGTIVGSSYRWTSTTLKGFARLELGIRDLYNGYYFGSTGPSSLSNTVLSLDSVVGRNDTVWILSYSTGAPTILTSEPAQVVMFKNPWETAYPGVRPMVSFDGTSVWNPMAPAAGMPGWYATGVSILPISMSFRDGQLGSSYLSGTGIGASRGLLQLDTLFRRNDTVWVVPSGQGSHSFLASAPVGRPVTLMLRNPWDSLNPGQPPHGRLEGADWKPFSPASGGWFSLGTSIDGNRLQVGIRNATGTSYLASYGLSTSSTSYLSLDTALARNDTIWIVPRSTNSVLAASVEPVAKSGVVMLLNPWEGAYPGLPPRVEIESQGQALMAGVPALPGWYGAPFQYFGNLVATFWDNGKSYSRGRYVLDTALAKNDTIWVSFPSNSTIPQVSSTQPVEKTATILFKSPWDSTAPFSPGSVQVEGRGWSQMSPVAGSPGWYSARVGFYGSLQLSIRDSKGSSYLYSNGTTTSTGSALLLDTAFARNDTVWIVGGAGASTPILVSTKDPASRPLTLMLLSPWEGAAPGKAPAILVNGRNWQAMSPPPTPTGWYSATLDFYGSLAVQIRNAEKTSYLYYGGLTASTAYTLVLDTAYAKNDTLWLYRAANGYVVAAPAPPVAKPVTILFKSPWDSAAPFAAGQFQVEGRGWRSLVEVAGSPGWYAGSDSFLGALQVSIRDANGTSYVAYSGTTTAPSTLLLDTAYSKNDTVWIVGSASYGLTTSVSTSPPTARALTVVLQSPWETASPGAAPSILVGGGNWRKFQPLAQRSGWYATSMDFYGPLSVQIRNQAGNSFLYYYGTTTSTGANLSLDTAYAKNDTIWIMAAPSQTSRIFSVDPDPRTVVLMLDNPWLATNPGSIPQMSPDGAVFSPMAPVAGDSGWFSAKLTYVDGSAVAIRMGTSYVYLGPDGPTGSWATLSLERMPWRNDTVWITRTREGKPPTLRSMDPRRSRMLMVFNPWDGVFPLQRPVAYLAGSSVGQILTPSLEACGWYFLETESHPREVIFRSSRTGEAFGAGGLGSTSPLDLSGQLADTVWISPQAGGARISHLASGRTGACAIALLPATVRDFAYAKLVPASSGLATNLVTDKLGLDRKPVVRRGSPALPLQSVWFRDSAGVNAATCRDLPMRLDTLSGVYRMANPAFYPIDDFTSLGGGGANPYNDRTQSGYTNNYGFCLESHGQFRYRRGQTDSVSGQDDIFHYINGRLVANLGGTHGTLVRGVGLDTLALVEGNVYPWDLFFCDRMSSTSVLNWTMEGLLAAPSARIDSTTAGNLSTLRAWSVSSTGQGCGRTEGLSPVRASVRLRGLYDSLWTDLPTGVHHGGIRVLDSTAVQVDTSAMTGLPYGIYVLRLRSSGDTLVFRDLVFQIPAPPGMHPYTPNARCDLMTGPIRSGVGCIDLSDLDGDTLRVARNTTRLATEGLVLCGGATTVVPGTDIVYLQDNSGSMGGSDPTSQRGIIVQDAIELHSQIAPSSNAAYIPFASGFSATQLYDITDPVERADLISSVTLGTGGGTNYAGALGWARVLLEGGKATGQTIAPSPNKNKAIIMISDGQPGDDIASMGVLLPNATTSYQNTAWSLPADTSVPVFGFMITTSDDALTFGKTLYDITQLTHGQFIVIPPNDPDSLRSAMMTVLGSIVARARPDTLRIANLANGQVSRGLSGGREGEGWRFRLDSLVGLEPGANTLQLRGVLSTDHGDSVVNARWTVMVGDSTDEFVVGGGDTTLMVACHAPTRLKVRPPSDTTRHFADARDASLSFWLDARYDRLLQNGIQFWTDLSADSGRKTLGTATTPDGIRAYSSIAVPWAAVPVSRRDSTVQTDFGWDTLRAVYRTPRDRRDTAVGFLPVFRSWPVSVRFEPDTVKGAKGDLKVFVRDPNVAGDTVRIKVFQNRRDSLWLVLRRDSTGRFAATLPFQQGANVVQGDSLLQAGPYRLAPLDSVFALYQTYRDTAILRRPDGRLRFVDAASRIMDSLPSKSLSIGGMDTLRVGLFVDTLLLSNSTDSVFASAPAWFSLRTLGGASSTGRLRLVSGKAAFVVAVAAPGSDGDVRIVRPAGPDTLLRRLVVGGVRIRFVDAEGRVLDTARVDRDVRSDTLLRAEVWDGGGLCSACDG